MKALAILTVFIFLFLGCTGKVPGRQAGITIEIKQPMMKVGLDLFLCIDESGSMLQTDPQKLRHEAGKYLIQNLLVKEADSKYPHRIGVVPFDDMAYGSELLDLQPPRASAIAARVTAHSPRPRGTQALSRPSEACGGPSTKPPSTQNPAGLRLSFLRMESPMTSGD